MGNRQEAALIPTHRRLYSANVQTTKQRLMVLLLLLEEGRHQQERKTSCKAHAGPLAAVVTVQLDPQTDASHFLTAFRR